jgi:hypothetical protein
MAEGDSAMRRAACLGLALGICWAVALGDEERKPFELPVDPADVTLTRIKADPEAYIGNTFTMAGGLEVDDYYNYGYRDASNYYASLRFFALDSKGRLSGASTGIYVSRLIGRPLLGRIVSASEKSERGTRVILGTHLKCTIHLGKIEGDLAHAADAIEILDWQIFEGGKFGPWEVVAEAERKRADRAAAEKEWAEALMKARDVTKGPPTKEVPPEVQAARQLKRARSLEKLGQAKQAAGFYRTIVDQYPDTPAAKTAAERLKSITPKAAKAPK